MPENDQFWKVIERQSETQRSMRLYPCPNINQIQSWWRYKFNYKLIFVLDSKPIVWFGWHNLRALFSSLLDVLWCNTYWEVNHQDAYSGKKRRHEPWDCIIDKFRCRLVCIFSLDTNLISLNVFKTNKVSIEKGG